MILRLVWSALLASLTVGCSTFSKASENNLYKVHVGEARADLVRDLGEPDSKSVDGMTEHWFYNIYSADNRKTYPYTAVIEGEVVKQWNFDTARNVVRERRQPTSQRFPY